MEWNYKNVIISVQSDGKFYFSIKENTHVANSLELAKSKIDEILKDYYTFNDREIKNLFDILPRLKYVGFFDYHHNY